MESMTQQQKNDLGVLIGLAARAAGFLEKEGEMAQRRLAHAIWNKIDQMEELFKES